MILGRTLFHVCRTSVEDFANRTWSPQTVCIEYNMRIVYFLKISSANHRRISHGVVIGRKTITAIFFSLFSLRLDNNRRSLVGRLFQLGARRQWRRRRRRWAGAVLVTPLSSSKTGACVYIT